MDNQLWISHIQITPLPSAPSASHLKNKILAVIHIALNQQIRLQGLLLTQNKKGELSLSPPKQDKVNRVFPFFQFVDDKLKKHIEKWVFSEWNLQQNQIK